MKNIISEIVQEWPEYKNQGRPIQDQRDVHCLIVPWSNQDLVKEMYQLLNRRMHVTCHKLSNYLPIKEKKWD